MSIEVLEKWHSLVKSKNVEGLGSILAEDPVFHSSVVHTSQVGKAVTEKYLAAAFMTLFNDSFNYVREIVGEQEAKLETVVELDGNHVNGVEIIKWNENNKIADFKVRVWPLKAINAIRERMVQGLKSV
ncbi:MAG: nuclear transport factor 2 family protein [Betaproteobacteria bacterium]|jgi:hypothetical protein|nr:MAG: nuclear transport factor 2 family protein [Betaproteobacteria bacterium]